MINCLAVIFRHQLPSNATPKYFRRRARRHDDCGRAASRLSILLLPAVLFAVSSAAEDAWPPQVSLSRKPLADPPYPGERSASIAIDNGRQLFVDDYLIESSDLTRTYHQPRYYSGNPVLAPERPWEKDHAAPFSDGVWFDPQEGEAKMFYWARGEVKGETRSSTCLAVSGDGLHWEKPDLGIVPGTNIVLLEDPKLPRNSSTVWLDSSEPIPVRRFKMFQNLHHPEGWRLRANYSPDGVHWTEAGDSDLCSDRTTVFYNPFRRVWVASLRRADKENVIGRYRAYHESAEVEGLLHWDKAQGASATVDWIGADELDADRLDLPLRRTADRPWDLVPSQLYNLDCVAYESLLLGLFTICRGHRVPPLAKINEVCVGYSRDGFHWSRPDRRPFCPLALNQPGWNAGNLQSVAGGCLVTGDLLYFYVGAVPYGAHFLDPGNVGAAILRRDGFASMDATAAGQLTTRPVEFHGSFLFVNCSCARGELRVEALEGSGQPIPPFTVENCEPIRVDSTHTAVSWRGVPDLARLRDRPVRWRFHLEGGELYSFWVAPTPAGASHGYVAAGGKGLNGSKDDRD